MASEVKAQAFVHQLEHGKGRWWVLFGLIVALAGTLLTCFLFIHVFRAMLRSDQFPLFKGLSHAKGMEQACVSRELARGNGYSTKVIKPAGIEMINTGKGEGTFNDLVNGNVAIVAKVKALAIELGRGSMRIDEVRDILDAPPESRAGKYSPKAQALLGELDALFHLTTEERTTRYGQIPEIYHSPLNPWINSIALRAMVGLNNSFKWRTDDEGKVDFWKFDEGDTAGLPDKTIAGVAILFFYAAIVLNYFTFKWIFDRRLSVVMVVIQLLCQQFWDFAATGLPQLLLLFLFSLAIMCLAKTLMAQTAGQSSWPWICGAGVAFGLMALAHPLTIFIFIGALIFMGNTSGPQKVRTEDDPIPVSGVARFFINICAKGGVMLLLAATIFIPWLVHNNAVCGDFKGLSWQSKSYQLRGTESQIMRTLKDPDETIAITNFGGKVIDQTLAQLDRLYYHLGKVPMAPVFFIALLHNFRRRETRLLMWGLFLMWLLAVFGMSFFGYADYELLVTEQSNDLHVLFIPFFGAYGLAFILNLWSRLEIQGHLLSELRFANPVLYFLLINLSAFPLWSRFLTPPTQHVNFPPYSPYHIALLGNWYNNREIIASDMPWGVAWYADRRSLWLPLMQKDYTKLNTFTFDDRLNSMFLTPISGARGYQSDIMVGEYRDWSHFIKRDTEAANSLKAGQASGLPFNTYIDLNIGDPRKGFAAYYILYADRDRWTPR